MTTLGQAVTALREKSGMSRSKLERAADVPYPTLLAVERDEGNPTLATIGKIAGALGLTAAELMAMVDGK